VRVVDFETAGVDFVKSESAVEIRQGGDARTHPSGSERLLSCLLSAVGCVVDHDVVFVRMTEKDARDYMRRVAVDNLIEQV